MVVEIFKDEDEIGIAAAGIIINCLTSKSNPVLGLATGASPVPMYKCLINAFKEGKISFKNTTTFNLDEYCSIPKNDKNSYWTFMHENLFNELDIAESNINVPDGNPTNTEEYCMKYDKQIIEAGGIDVQVLGIGRNGHVGFNEPADSFTKGTYKVRLTQDTIDANKIYFDSVDDMPKYAITMGIESILNAKEIILIATGKSKAEAVREMINGDITPKCPASILQKHSNVHVFLDEDAASLL